LPEQAKLMHRIALIRGIKSVENDHFLSEVYTGLPRSSGKRPAFGSLITRLSARSTNPLPPYVSLNSEAQSSDNNYEQPHYAGAGFGPFRPIDEALDDLAAVASLDRLQERRTLLAEFDRLRATADRVRDFNAFDHYQAHALDIITSSAVRDAFDLNKEPPGTLQRYGHKQGQFTHQTVKRLLYDWDAKAFVQARRLIEAGVRLVTVSVGNWDHHSSPEADIFYSLGKMVPALDRTLAALFNDLHERGLDRDVGVVVLGEFGRTPKITTNGAGVGREHWADAGCALFYGGGWRTGQVIGATDARAERSVDGAIGFQNIMATIYRLFGIDPQSTIPDFNGRPQYLLDTGEPIRGLVSTGRPAGRGRPS
jgi:hypothetical protein